MFDDLFAHEAFALVRMRGADEVTLIAGPRTDIATLAEIPMAASTADGWQSLVLVPFAQAQERGFVAHQDGTPLSVIRADVQREVPLDDVLAALPDAPIEFTDRGGFETSDADYAALVRKIIDDEIGQGEGANLVIGRKYRAAVSEWG